MRCAIALILLGGCHVVFGVDPSGTEPPDDAAETEDASTDAPDPPPCASSTPYTMQVSEDTFIVPDLSGCNPATRFGGLPHLALGQDDVSRILLRFELPPDALLKVQAGVPLSDGTLTLAASDVATSTSSEVAVFPLKNEWNEGSPTAPYAGASWCNAVGVDAMSQTRWIANGADASEDRGQVALGSAPILDIETTPDSPVTVKLPASRIGAARSWISNEKGYLSLILIRTSAMGTLYLQAREASRIPAVLELRICD